MVVDHVFHRNGDDIRYFRRCWISACIAAGLGKVVTDDGGRVVDRVAFRIPHDYRRSAARNLSRAGVPERVIMELCGWKTRSVFDRYRIVSERDLAEGLAKLAPPAPQKKRKVVRMTPRGAGDRDRSREHGQNTDNFGRLR
jgi:integrase